MSVLKNSIKFSKDLTLGLSLSLFFVVLQFCFPAQNSFAQTTTTTTTAPSCKVQETTYNKTLKAEEKALAKFDSAKSIHETKLTALKAAYDKKIADIDQKIKNLPLSGSITALKCGAGFFDKKATIGTKSLIGTIGGLIGLGGNSQRCANAALRIANQKKRLEDSKVKAKTDYDKKVKLAVDKLAAVEAKAKTATEKKVKANADLTACKAGGVAA